MEHDLMDVSQSFLAGNPTQQSWSQAYALRRVNDFFGVVISVNSTIDDPSQLGKTLLSHCVDAASAGLTREQFLSLFKDWDQKGVDVAGVYFSGNSVLLFSQGEASIHLNRKGREQTLLSGKTQGSYIQGSLEPGDYYVLGTSVFFQNFPSFDPSRTPQDICDEYVTSLQGFSEAARVGVLLVHLAKEVEMQASVSPEKNESFKTRVVPIVPAEVHRESRLPRFKLKLHFSRSSQNERVLRVAMAVGATLFVFLFLSWFITMRKTGAVAREITPYQQRFDTLIALGADKRLEEMQGLRELSRDLGARKKESKDSSLVRAYDKLLSSVDQAFSQISGEKHLERLHVFYDFRLVAADFVASKVAYDQAGKLALFLDASHRRLLSLSLEKKQALTLSVDEKLGSPISLAVENRKAHVLGGEGVMVFSLPLDILGNTIINRDKNWMDPKYIDTFGTNIYVLDSGARTLFKYDTENPSASPSSWFKNKIGLDFETITSMRIDGGVWLGTSNGKIFHFAQGSPVPFSYQELIDAPESPVYIYTTKESGNLYVLEPHAARLLILSKEGVYKAAVISPDLSTATGLVVDETTNRAYVLSGSLVYEVEL